MLLCVIHLVLILLAALALHWDWSVGWMYITLLAGAGLHLLTWVKADGLSNQLEIVRMSLFHRKQNIAPAPSREPGLSALGGC